MVIPFRLLCFGAIFKIAPGEVNVSFLYLLSFVELTIGDGNRLDEHFLGKYFRQSTISLKVLRSDSLEF